MYNKVILVGNLTRDIEIRYTQSGSAIGNTAIATTKRYKGQDGQQKEDTTFIDITFFGRTAEIANQYLHKGSKILVEGRIKFDQWKAQDGTNRSKHSIIVESLQMLDSKSSQGQQPQAQGQENGQQQPPKQEGTVNTQNKTGYGSYGAETVTPPLPEVDINEDEIPF